MIQKCSFAMRSSLHDTAGLSVAIPKSQSVAKPLSTPSPHLKPRLVSRAVVHLGCSWRAFTSDSNTGILGGKSNRIPIGACSPNVCWSLHPSLKASPITSE